MTASSNNAGRNLMYNKSYSTIALPKGLYYWPFKYTEGSVKGHNKKYKQ